MRKRELKRPLSVCIGISVAALGLLVALGWDGVQSAELSPQPSMAKTVKAQIRDADLIRVGISDDAMLAYEYPAMTLSGTGEYRVVSKTTGQTVLTIPAFQNLRVSKTAQGFLLSYPGGQVGPVAGELVVQVSNPAVNRLRIPSITRKGIIPSYRGVLELLPGASAPDKLTVVNVLPLQDYLKAVVPNELPISYGYEAVKAQAIAARNYAIKPREKPWNQFDICDSQYCQAYYGANTEHPQTSKALEDTTGLVALYDGDPILALYSSSHGGVAERYENVFSDSGTNRFPGTPVPYLIGGPDGDKLVDLSSEDAARTYYTTKPTDSFDILSPNYRWQKHWDRASMERSISANLASVSKDRSTQTFVQPSFAEGGTIGTLKDIRVTRRGISGKAMRIEIEGTNGVWAIEKEFVIRKVLQHNGRMLPSANVVFDLTRDANKNILSIKASGGGFGHGVGMSQLGASAMSKNGHGFIDILQHYYKGVAIGSIPVSAQAGMGSKAHFFVDAPKGQLRVKGTGTSPVRVAINGKELIAMPGSAMPVESLLKPHQLNMLEILPLNTATTEQATAWVELVPPKPIPSWAALPPNGQ